jgi:polar amino acid transport system substrate-binding protein
MRARALLASLLLASCASGPQALVVASDLDNPPFASVDESGVPVGRDVEMMQEIAAHLGRRLEWKRMPFDRLLAAVETREVDLVCATIGVTPERAERVAFTRPYYRTAIAVVVRVGRGEPTSLAELAGKRVAAGAGTTSQRAVQRRLGASIGVFENKGEVPAGERLITGEIDAAVMDGPAADALVGEGLGRLARLPEGLATESYALVLPKGEQLLLAELDVHLERLDRTGRLRRLNERFGL